MILLYILIGILTAARAVYLENQSLDYYRRKFWYNYSLTVLFNFLLWPITIAMAIGMKRYTVELDREWLKRNYPNPSKFLDENGNITAKR